MRCEWESCVGVQVNMGRLGGIVKPTWSWIYSVWWQCVPMCWSVTWHKLYIFLGHMDVSVVLIGLANLDQALYVCFSTAKAPKQ